MCNWWTRQDSNLRPAVCKTDALPAELRVRDLPVYQCATPRRQPGGGAR